MPNNHPIFYICQAIKYFKNSEVDMKLMVNSILYYSEEDLFRLVEFIDTSKRINESHVITYSNPRVFTYTFI